MNATFQRGVTQKQMLYTFLYHYLTIHNEYPGNGTVVDTEIGNRRYGFDSGLVGGFHLTHDTNKIIFSPFHLWVK